MSSTNRATKIKSLYKFLQKRYKHVPETQPRKVLEHLIYAACLENATFEQADHAFSVLEHHYIDWNEIRVSTAAELAYTFPHLPDALAAGERIRKSLQAVFETTYVFDLEELRKKSLSQAVELLDSLSVCSRFMVDYTTHNALGGHVIPLDESAKRVFRLLGLAQTNKENTREDVSGLERAIMKQEGHDFANLLHHFAVDFYKAESPKELQQILKSIDSQATNRDWTAPVLQIAKPVKPEKPRPVIAPLPAAALDDDDVTDSVTDVEEVEFIPNPITGEESSFEPDDGDDEDGITTKKPKQATKKPAAKSPKSPSKDSVAKKEQKKPEAAKPDVQKAKPIKVETPKPTPKKPEPQKAAAKKAETIPGKAAVSSDLKNESKKPKSSDKKPQPPKSSKTDSSPKASAPPEKSPMRTLRQKKPK